MKRFYKIILIAALICIVFGFGMVAVGAVQGGMQSFLNMVDNNEFSISGGNIVHFGMMEKDEKEYEDRDYSFPVEAIDKLELDIGASLLEVKYEDGDQYQVQVRQSKRGYISCEEDEGTLNIESGIESSTFNLGGEKGNKIILTIPKDAKLREIELTLGAGSCTGDRLCADTIFIEVGAGNLEVDKLKAEKTMELTVGAGNIEVDKIEAGQLEVECEVGRCYAKKVTTKADIDLSCDAGYVYMGLQAAEESYNYDLSCSIGSLKIAGQQYNGVDFSKDTDHGADKELTAECNVGAIEIEFDQ